MSTPAKKKAPAKKAAPPKKPALGYPVKKLVVPAALKGVPNGKLPAKDLKTIKGGGTLYTTAAESFNAMWLAAQADKITLSNQGDYRTYARQLALFRARYSTKDAGRKPKVTRQFEGKTWYLKPGCAPCATPGTSNHGLGLAIDLDTRQTKVFDWLRRNGPKYGFYLQGKPTKPDGKPNPEYEPWHWQKVNG
jgi:LAS superfamily LD-carboxypeptidase LdcB